jgi:hypothetical protein
MTNYKDGKELPEMKTGGVNTKQLSSPPYKIY